jgi:hypothetical protein
MAERKSFICLNSSWFVGRGGRPGVSHTTRRNRFGVACQADLTDQFNSHRKRAQLTNGPCTELRGKTKFCFASTNRDREPRKPKQHGCDKLALQRPPCLAPRNSAAREGRVPFSPLLNFIKRDTKGYTERFSTQIMNKNIKNTLGTETKIVFLYINYTTR